MKRKEKIYIIFLLLILIITVIAFWLYKKQENRNLLQNNITINTVEIELDFPDESTVDTYNTSERIEQYAPLRTVEKVRMEIKEGTLTNNGATIVIYDDNEYHYAYQEFFTLERKENGEWKEVPYKEGENGILVLFNELASLPSEKNPIEIKQNWGRIYGELLPGEYRLIKSVHDYKGEEQFFYVEFTI